MLTGNVAGNILVTVLASGDFKLRRSNTCSTPVIARLALRSGPALRCLREPLPQSWPLSDALETREAAPFRSDQKCPKGNRFGRLRHWQPSPWRRVGCRLVHLRLAPDDRPWRRTALISGRQHWRKLRREIWTVSLGVSQILDSADAA